MDVVNRRKGDILTEKELLEKYGKDQDQEKSSICSRIRSKFRCNRRSVKNKIEELIPFVSWIRRYPVKKWITGDVSSGFTVGIVNLPQAMAYASLAAMPPINGLFTSFIPTLVYALFGTSRHLSIGTFAIVSIMVGDSISSHVPDDYCDAFTNVTTGIGENMTVTSFECDVDHEREKYAIAISLVMGFIFFFMYLCQLGFISVYLSTHMISGFTCAASFHVFTSQLDKLFDIKVQRQQGLSAMLKSIIEVGKGFKGINFYTSTISVVSILFLFAGKEINFRNRERLPFPLPWELVVVIVAAIASYFGGFEEHYAVSVVGNIPTGIRTTMPEPKYMGEVFLEAVPIAVVSYAITISLARMFATKHGYEINSNQELFAFTIVNTAGSFFGCFPAATSLSRSVIQDDAGGNTQIAGIISSFFILIVLLWIGPLFEQLPRAALAAIIVVNLKRLMKQFSQLPDLWKVSKIDVTIWLMTWFGVFFLGVDTGLLLGIFISIFSVTVRSQTAVGSVMIPVTSKPLYRSSTRYDGDVSSDSDDVEDDVVIFSYPAAIHFANKDSFKSQISSTLGFDPSKERVAKEKAAKKLKAMVKSNGYVNEGNTIDVELDMKKIDEKKSGKKEISCLLLDMKCCSFVDNDGCITLLELYKDLHALEIQLLFANCDYTVYQTLLNAGFDEIIEEELAIFYVTVQAAHTFALLNKKPAPPPLANGTVNRPIPTTSTMMTTVNGSVAHEET